MRSSTRPLTGGLLRGSVSNSDSLQPARRTTSPSGAVVLAAGRLAASGSAKPIGPTASSATRTQSTAQGALPSALGVENRPGTIWQLIG